MNALVRAVPASFSRAQRAWFDPHTPIDVDRARAQHAAYVAFLRRLGDAVVALPSPDDQPDAVFVEDTAVVHAGRAVLGRSAVASRAGEHDVVGGALRAAGLELVALPEGATLDGGDVLVASPWLFVGLSTRTNALGARAVAAAFSGLRPVFVPLEGRSLHLKCSMSAAGDRIVVVQGALPPEVVAEVRPIEVPPEEGYAANVVGDGRRVAVPAGYPRAAAALDAAGFAVEALEVGEIRKADGSLTCLSVRW